MKKAIVAALSLALSVGPALAQKGKKGKPPEPPKRTCEDGSTAAEDGSCPEDFIRKCQDGQPAAEDGTCPEDLPPEPVINYYNVPVEVKGNLDLAVVSFDDLEVGPVPLVGEARLSEGPHTFSVVFPGFAPYVEEIAVFPEMTSTGVKREVELLPVNEDAKALLSSPRALEKFLDSGLTVDGYLAYNQASKVKRFGLFTLIGGGAAFAGFITTRVVLENQDSPAVTLPFTVGLTALLIGAPTYGYGRYKAKQAQANKRDAEFLRKPPEPKEVPAAPKKKAPASAPASLPAPASAPIEADPVLGS